MNGVNFSASQIKAISKMLKGESTSQEESGLTKREYNEIKNTFGI
jgi:hypothetical protein